MLKLSDGAARQRPVPRRVQVNIWGVEGRRGRRRHSKVLRGSKRGENKLSAQRKSRAGSAHQLPLEKTMQT